MAEPSKRLQSEVGLLARLAATPTIPALDRAVAILVLHQRRDAGTCLCGWGRLGASFAHHQADVLSAAGLLAATELTGGVSAV